MGDKPDPEISFLIPNKISRPGGKKFQECGRTSPLAISEGVFKVQPLWLWSALDSMMMLIQAGWFCACIIGDDLGIEQEVPGYRSIKFRDIQLSF
ncbi:MAG: hypothetical protein R3C68_11255 [Myxococcota bacterium]